MIVSDTPGQVEALRATINSKVKREMGEEKARARVEQTRIAQKLQSEGSRHVEGLGQKIGSIDARTFFRLHQENPGCWQNEGFIRETLRDSPKLRAPGYGRHSGHSVPRVGGSGDPNYSAGWERIFGAKKCAPSPTAIT